MTERYRIDVSKTAPSIVSLWLASLSEEQRQELARIDYGYRAGNPADVNRSVKSVTEDWIEEHGGERIWWRYIMAAKER